ncbi:rho guanine nucleotide exchange factor 8 [Lolium perenne]|uniref:rho guanine nucleotide exchange factor 8 n=1 Tax=Lolium perenne TaxID=4522 RepID=UPI0021EB1B6D|nr:rho guanine nucleotide exchange factor 8-like [Lolium perenne]
MARGFLGRGHSLDRFLPGRRVMASSQSFPSSPSPSSSECSCSGRGGMDEEEIVAASPLPPLQKRTLSRGHGSRAASGRRHSELPAKKVEMPSEMDLMQERFAKLLLGEDMSGTGRGVSSALALSNSITNLAASVFGEQRRLEPMKADRRMRWKKEIDWILSVTDHIVEFVPLQHESEDGTSMEVMGTQLRKDILMNLPALRKLDAMLLGYLDNFKDEQEFWYVSKDADESEKGDSPRNGEKWWIPTVRVPPEGLSDQSRKWLQHQKDLVGQVLKAVMAMNADVLTEMEIPEEYIESLPKNGRDSLGDSIYRTITDDHFDPNELLNSVDLSTEHKIVDLKDKIEASVVIWQRKLCNKLYWGPGSLEKREQFEERAETVLLILKQKFPGTAQSSLDISKIQYNKDVGFAILESYSRSLESLAFAVLSRIEDVLYADNVARDPRRSKSKKRSSLDDIPQSFVVDDTEASSARAGDSLNWDELEDRSLDCGGAKLRKVPRIVSRKRMHVEKIE